jgi:hypothetical protein
MNKVQGLGKVLQSGYPQEAEKSNLEELEQVVLHIEFAHASEEDLPVGIVHVFHDEAVIRM